MKRLPSAGAVLPAAGATLPGAPTIPVEIPAGWGARRRTPAAP